MAIAYAYYDTGETVVGVIRSAAGEYADVVLEAMETYDADDIDDYDIAATETGNTGEYRFDWPEWLAAGAYAVHWIPLAGATIAETDFVNRFAVPNYYWDGTTLTPGFSTYDAAVVKAAMEAADTKLSIIRQAFEEVP